MKGGRGKSGAAADSRLPAWRQQAKMVVGQGVAATAASYVEVGADHLLTFAGHLRRRSGALRRTCLMVLWFDRRLDDASAVAGSVRLTGIRTSVRCRPWKYRSVLGCTRRCSCFRWLKAQVLAWPPESKWFQDRAKRRSFCYCSWPPLEEKVRRFAALDYLSSAFISLIMEPSEPS